MKQLQACLFVFLAGLCVGLFWYVHTFPVMRFYLETEVPFVANGLALERLLFFFGLALICLIGVWLGYSAFLAKWLKKPFHRIVRDDAVTYLPLCLLAIVVVPGAAFPIKQVVALFQLSNTVLAFMAVLGVFYLKGSYYTMLRGQRTSRQRRLAWKTLPTWKHSVIIFCVSVGVYTIVGLQLKENLPLGGDEAHYLLISHSLIYDRDLAIQNNYQQQDYRAFGVKNLDKHVTLGKDGTRYPGHPIGLSVLLIPFYGLFGHQGALILINMMAAILAVQLYLLAFVLTRNQYIALILWGLCSFTAPLWLYSSQIYPEIPSACLLAIAFRLIAYPVSLKKKQDGRIFSLTQVVLIGLTLGSLLWIQQRMILPATLLMLYYISTSGILPWNIIRGKRRIPWIRLIPVISFAIFGLSLAGYYYVLYGNPMPSAPYRSIAMTTVFSWEIFFKQGMLGLWLDQEAGLFMVAPHYVMIVPGFILLLRRNWREALGICLLVLSIYVACGGFVLQWYGAWSPASRYMVTLIPLLLPLLAESILYVRSLELRMGLAFLSILSLGWSFLFFRSPVLSIMRGNGINSFLEYYRTPIADPSLYFPAFQALSPGMYVMTGIWILIILGLSWWCVSSSQQHQRSNDNAIQMSPLRRLQRLATVYALGFVIVFVMTCITPLIPPRGRSLKVAQNFHLHKFLQHLNRYAWRIAPENILNSSLAFEYVDRIKYGHVNQQGPRFLVTGPRETFPAGKYRAYFLLRIDDSLSPDISAALIDIVDDSGRVGIASKDLYGADFPTPQATIAIQMPFELVKQANALEVRLFFRNRVGMQLETLEIRPDFADFYANAGVNALWTGNMARARTIFSKSVTAGSKKFVALYQLGVLYQQEERWEESLPLLQQAAAIQPDFADIHYRLGLALYHIGEQELARKYLKKATTLLPEHLDAWQALQNVYRELGLKNLEQRAEQVVTMLYDPEYVYAVNWGNQIMFLGYRTEPAEAGKFRIHYYWKALTPMPNDYVIFVHFKDDATVFQQDHDPHKTETLSRKQVFHPTSQWQVGEVVHEQFEISAPSGTFNMMVGVWDPKGTQKRLPIFTSASLRDKLQNQLTLQEKIIIP